MGRVLGPGSAMGGALHLVFFFFFLAGGGPGRAAERTGQLAARAGNAPEAARAPLGEVRLATPVPAPSKIICIGLNYRDHAAETGHELPTKPTVFAKFPSALTGPYDPIVLPALRERVEGGAGPGGVTGPRPRNVREDEALSYV